MHRCSYCKAVEQGDDTLGFAVRSSRLRDHVVMILGADLEMNLPMASSSI
jgi:hypothetical protein